MLRSGSSSARRRICDASRLVALQLSSSSAVDRVEQRHAAARHDALFDRRAGRRERVLDAVFFSLQLDLGGRADLDHADAAGQLGQPLLQLLAVVVAGGVLDLRLESA